MRGHDSSTVACGRVSNIAQMDDTLYKKISATAEAHIYALLPRTPGSNDPDSDAILSHLDRSCRINWGHDYFVSTNPRLQGERTGEEFVAHMSGMAPALQTWKIEITNICVDVKTRSAVVRADFQMVPRNADAIVNDIIFWMMMDEDGEKIRRCTEFVDPSATMELASRMKASTPR